MNDDFVVNGECYKVDLTVTPAVMRRWNRETWNWVKVRTTADIRRRLLTRYETVAASSPTWPKMLSR